ncbi:MAG: hypothetical protein M1825_005815 [Sarcosagium campestre]|nr:MAG: hypothetical protein M1825_005815 [Sarcosagium campestre]
MSAPKFFAYHPVGEYLRETLGYSQAVRVGDRIEASGQGGWDPKADGADFPRFPGNIKDEVAQAFANADLVLRNAGGKGLSQVFRVTSYHTDLTPEVTAYMTEGFRKWIPGQSPIWTQIGVRQLGAPDMHVEIEVVAYNP